VPIFKFSFPFQFHCLVHEFAQKWFFNWCFSQAALNDLCMLFFTKTVTQQCCLVHVLENQCNGSCIRMNLDFTCFKCFAHVVSETEFESTRLNGFGIILITPHKMSEGKTLIVIVTPLALHIFHDDEFAQVDMMMKHFLKGLPGSWFFRLNVIKQEAYVILTNIHQWTYFA
jgi:hypothetical protein